VKESTAMINELAVEREHKRKSSLYTMIFHVVLLILALFSTCEYKKAVDSQYAVAINFEEIVPPKLEEMTGATNSNKGREAEGKERKKADRPAEIKDDQTKTVETKRPEIKLPKPTPTPPAPTTEPVISETILDEESDVVAAEEEIEIDDLAMEEIPEIPVEAPPTHNEAPAEEPAKESVKSRIGKILDVFKTGGSSDNGNPSGEPSARDGKEDGTGEGNSGTGRGNDSSGNDGDSGVGTGGSGTGKYDSSGNGIFGRRVIKRNVNEILRVQFENQENKKIVAKVCINRQGNVSFSELLFAESTAKIPAGKEKDVLKGIYGYKYEAEPDAPYEECGKLTIVLQNISALTGR